MIDVHEKRFANLFCDDVTRMERCLQPLGKQVSAADIIKAWSTYSDDLCASWLGVPEDDAVLLEILLDYLPSVGTTEVYQWLATLTRTDDTTGACSLALPQALMKCTGWQDGATLTIVHDEHGQLIIRLL